MSNFHFHVRRYPNFKTTLYKWLSINMVSGSVTLLLIHHYLYYADLTIIQLAITLLQNELVNIILFNLPFLDENQQN